MKHLLGTPMENLVRGFTDMVNQDSQLKSYRDWVEENAFGFGERCFLHMWKLIVDDMPDEFTFCEVGVFRGQILGLIGMLAERTDKKVKRVGISPLDSTDGHWESDYEADIRRLHDKFGIQADYEIIHGHSQEHWVIKKAQEMFFDIMYIDGGHAYDVVVSDLDNYDKLVKRGGYLVIDDCNNRIQMPDGMFRGIQSVSDAVDERYPPFTQRNDWELQLNLVHNRVLKRI
jgi:hypothetical protein